jgi:hypothetical protein
MPLNRPVIRSINGCLRPAVAVRAQPLEDGAYRFSLDKSNRKSPRAAEHDVAAAAMPSRTSSSATGALVIEAIDPLPPGDGLLTSIQV